MEVFSKLKTNKNEKRKVMIAEKKLAIEEIIAEKDNVWIEMDITGPHNPHSENSEKFSILIEIIENLARKRNRFCDGVDEEILNKMTKKEREKQELIFEFIETEINYNKDLKLIISEYIHPIRSQQILSNEDINQIFLNIEKIEEIQSKLLKELLEERENNLIIINFSCIIIKYVYKMEIYIEYCSKHSIALKKVTTISEKNEKFKNFLLERKSRMTESLQGYLVKPFQRFFFSPLSLLFPFRFSFLFASLFLFSLPIFLYSSFDCLSLLFFFDL